MSKKTKSGNAAAKAIEGSYTDLDDPKIKFVLKDGKYRIGHDRGTYTASQPNASTIKLRCVSTHPDLEDMESVYEIRRDNDHFIFNQLPDEIDLCGQEQRFKRAGGPDSVPISDSSKKIAAANAADERAKASAPTLPVSDFLNHIWDWGHPEWIVLAVEAPIEKATPLYQSLAKAKNKPSWPNVEILPRNKKDDEMANLVPIVQTKDCKWSVIYRLMCFPIGMPDIENAQKAAQDLSAKLKTRALAFFGEDTSGAMSFNLYRNGKSAGATDWESQNDPADAAFKKLNLSIPPCFARQQGKKTWLSTNPSWTNAILRADVIDIGDL